MVKMEKLTEEQRLKVSRMSYERLRGKLINAGYKEDDIARLDRPRRYAVRYAQVLLAETAYVGGGMAHTIAGAAQMGVSNLPNFPLPSLLPFP